MVLTSTSFIAIALVVLLIAPWRQSTAVQLRMGTRELWGGSRLRALGTVLASGALSAALLVGIAIEHEVRTGNARLVKASGADYFVVQEGARDWINSSFLSIDDLEFLRAQENVSAWGTQRFFASDDGEDLFVVSYSDPHSIFAPHIDIGRLALTPNEVVADVELGRNVGSVVHIAGQSFRVVGLTSATSSLGKQSVFLIEPAVQAVTGISGFTVLGVRATDRATPMVPAGSELLTAAEFLKGNEGFWKRNGTLIVTSLLLAIVLLSVLSSLATKRTDLLLSRRPNAVLLVVGADRQVVIGKELLKAAIRAVVGVPAGVLFASVALQALNASVDGLASKIEPQFVLWTLALVMAIPTMAVLLATVQFRRAPLVRLMADN